MKEAGQMAIELTPKAAEKVKDVVRLHCELPETKGNPENMVLRVRVKGGGCAGLSYELELDQKANIDPENDKTFFQYAVTVVVDKKSYLYLNGSTIDYAVEGLRAGFRINNPNATSSCGCGISHEITPQENEPDDA